MPTGLWVVSDPAAFDDDMGETRDQRKGLGMACQARTPRRTSGKICSLTSASECLWEDRSRANESKITASFQSLRRLHAVYKGHMSHGCIQGCKVVMEGWRRGTIVSLQVVDSFASLSSQSDDDDNSEGQIKRLLRCAAVAAPHAGDTFCLVSR